MDNPLVPILLSDHDLTFCRVYAERGAIAAYEATHDTKGMTRREKFHNARLIFGRPEIRAEVSSAKKALVKHHFKPERLIKDLVSSAIERDLNDLFEESESGIPVMKRWSEIPREAKKLIKEIEYEEPVVSAQGEVIRNGKCKIKLIDSGPDKDRLIKIFGMSKEAAPQVNVVTGQINLADWGKLAALMAEKEAMESLAPRRVEVVEQSEVVEQIPQNIVDISEVI